MPAAGNRRANVMASESLGCHSSGLFRRLPFARRAGSSHRASPLSSARSDKTVLDIGSSTGGFTDAALQKGAKMSYALDVGTNQLAWKLRQDDRVVVMENTNFRYSKKDDFTSGQPDFATIDVSFISLHLILPNLHSIIKEGGSVVALIKPQFEAGREKVGKHGIVHDPKTHLEVVQDIMAFSASVGYDVCELDFSPITGGQGNIEFLIHLKSVDGEGKIMPEVDAAAVVKQAHAVLEHK